MAHRTQQWFVEVGDLTLDLFCGLGRHHRDQGLPRKTHRGGGVGGAQPPRGGGWPWAPTSRDRDAHSSKQEATAAVGVGGARHSALLSARAGVPDPLCRLSVPVKRIWGNRPEFGFDVSLAEGAATPKRPASVTCRCARRGVLAARRPRPGRAPTPALRAAASGFAVNPAA